MAHEDAIAAILEADATLTAILTGGIYTGGEVGPLGITRDTEATDDAFDGDGWLLPCALVKEAAIVATADVTDYGEQVQSARQRVEIWLYQDRTYVALDSARARIRTLLMGRILDGTFELRLAQEWTRLRDPGALSGSSMAKMDWQVDFIQ